MHSYLLQKATSLALESKNIRNYELKFAKQAKKALSVGKDRSAAWHEKNREGQYLHRIGIVREEARATNIARGFLLGHEYGEIEQKAWVRPDWVKIQDLVSRFAERDNPRWNRSVEDSFSEWRSRAQVYFKEHQIKHAKPKKERNHSLIIY